MEKIIVSIVIVNYNGKNLLKTILASFKKSSFKGYEIIILDNNSSDGSPEFIKKNYKKINLIVNKKNLGYTGINNALRFCKGKYILFLNNDMEIERNCITELVKILKSDNSIGMVAPRLVNYYNKKLISGGTWLSRAFYNGHIKGNMKSKDMIVPYLGVGLIKKSIIDTYGYLFDPDYFIYGEDVDLGLRVRLLGKKTVFASNAIIYHMHALTTKKNLKSSKTTYLMERNLLTSFFKNMPLSRVFLYLPYVLILRASAMVKDALSFNFEGLFARIKAILWIVFNFYKVISKRSKTQKHRKASTKFILGIFDEKHLYKKKFLV